jgi:aspartate/methionine/tyrosine aminotransferase
LNPHVESIPPSLIRAIHARKREGDLDFGLGEPRLKPDPAPFEEAVARVRDHGCPYSPNAGYPELRERIAGYVGVAGGAAAACVTVGSEEALYLAIKALLDPARDEVLIVEPCYLAYPSSACWKACGTGWWRWTRATGSGRARSGCSRRCDRTPEWWC